jgi:hypothetical protein
MARIASFEQPVMIFLTVRSDSSSLPRIASFEHPVVMIFSTVQVRPESSKGSLSMIASFEHPICMVFSAAVVASRRVSEKVCKISGSNSV